MSGARGGFRKMKAGSSLLLSALSQTDHCTAPTE